MRGDERAQGMMFATVVLEDRIPATHPLRAIRRLVDPILRDLSPHFEALYSATGGEAEDALCLLHGVATDGRRATIGAGKGYDMGLFVDGARATGFTPHVAAKTSGGSIDGRTTRHAGYAVSRRKRKVIEEVFGWRKTVVGLRTVRHRGTPWWIGSSPSPAPQKMWSVCDACSCHSRTDAGPEAARHARKGRGGA